MVSPKDVQEEWERRVKESGVRETPEYKRLAKKRAIAFKRLKMIAKRLPKEKGGTPAIDEEWENQAGLVADLDKTLLLMEHQYTSTIKPQGRLRPF